MTIERRIVIVQVQGTLNSFKECVFSQTDKVERFKKSDSLRKVLYSEIGELRDLSFNFFVLIDEISLEIIAKTNYDGNDSLSIWE